MKIRKNNRGFTLVELLLVMAIIGILAGVIFVTTAPARKKARITTFKQHMKDLTTAASVCIDSDGTLPASVSPDGNTVFCAAVSNDNVPLIKECKGGKTAIPAITITDVDNDDFVITASCPVTGGTPPIDCFAYCTVNGCFFNSTAAGAAAGTADGCPKT